MSNICSAFPPLSQQLVKSKCILTSAYMSSLLCGSLSIFQSYRIESDRQFDSLTDSSMEYLSCRMTTRTGDLQTQSDRNLTTTLNNLKPRRFGSFRVNGSNKRGSNRRRTLDGLPPINLHPAADEEAKFLEAVKNLEEDTAGSYLKGISKSSRVKLLNKKDDNGQTVLHRLPEYGDIHYGAGLPEMYQLLLYFGANPNIQDVNGQTPAHCLAIHKSYPSGGSIITILKLHKANFNLLDRNHETAHQLLQKKYPVYTKECELEKKDQKPGRKGWFSALTKGWLGTEGTEKKTRNGLLRYLNI